MPTLHIEFNPTGGNNFMVKYRPDPATYGSTLPWTEAGPFLGSPIDITVPYLIPYEFCIWKICGTDASGGQIKSWEVCNTGSQTPECLTPTLNFISRSGGDFTFAYTLQPNQPIFQLQILDPNGIQILWQTFQAALTPSLFTYTIPSLISGTYRFRIRGICGPSKLTSPASNWTAYEDVTVAVSGCTAPSDIVEALCQMVAVTNASVPMPNAISGQPYEHILYLTGTPPFDFEFDTVPTPPAWMSANYVLDGSGNHTIKLTGTPSGGDVGVPQGLKLKLKNCGNTYDQSGVVFTGSFNVVLGTLVQSFEINSTLPATTDTEFDLLINTINVSGHRTLAAGDTIFLDASGSGVNNPSSEVIVQFRIDMPTFPASANLVYTGGTVAGVWNNTLKTFTFSGIDTSVAQTLVINLLP